MNNPTHALHKFAAKLEDTTQDVACKGTAIEKTTYKTRNKAFLFLGPADAMLKLNDSIDEAKTFAAKLSGNCKVGIGGWVTLKFADGETVPLDVLTRWVNESYQLFASYQKNKTAKTKPTPKKSKKK
jgi:hypothetical protein